MIAADDLKKTAREYLRAATVLRDHQSYDAAVYLCGYAVEIALKARICKTLKWTTGFPETNAEFNSKSALKTHDLEALLDFTSMQHRIKSELVADWSVVKLWRPEQRYKSIGTKSLADADDMITATRTILKVVLWR